ncbi:MAG TPA: MBL fold metallo-hydrolase [Gammaproteobacteria bacterium]|nr:MBL fold metallo-hydrolase [Gammaproteobacteria bacterium]
MNTILNRAFVLIFAAVTLISCQSESTKSSDNGLSSEESKVVSKYPPIDIEMTAKKLAEHTYQVQGKAGIATDNAGFISNAGFVVTDEGVIVIDTLGSPSLGVELLKRIREVTDKPIKKVVITHYHADHIYGTQVFKELGAEVIAADGSFKYINSDGATARLNERRESLKPYVNEDTYVVHPDVIVEDKMEFELGGMHFVINVVGAAHSGGDLTLYVQEDGVLYSGDIIFGGRVPFIGGGSTLRWANTLQDMENSLKLNLLVPGHGPASDNPAQAIKLTKSYLLFMREVMGEAVEEMMGFVEAYEGIDWSQFSSLPAFDSVNRLNANTVFLAMEAESVE